MFSRLFRISMAFAGVAGALVALQQPTSASSVDEATFAGVGASTSVPYGWVDFCKRYEGECGSGTLPAADVVLDARALKAIAKVNHWVNAHVQAVSDMEHWGVADRWDLPLDGKGDCEDYALLKRKMLMELGLPRQALLMTVVKDENNDGHAILTIKTNRGEYALDNLNDEMKPWAKTGYRYVKRQSQEDPQVWVALGAPKLAAK